jgi:hypothetical protein
MDNTPTILSELNNIQMEVQKTQDDQTANLMSAEERRFFANETRERENMHHILDNVQNAHNEIHSSVENNGSDNKETTIRGISDIRASQERLAHGTGVQLEKITSELTNYFYDVGVRDTNSHQRTLYKMKDIEFDIGKMFNHTQKEILGVATHIENQSLAQFGKLQSDLLKVEHSLGRQNDTHFSVLQNQATQNANQLQIQALQLNTELVKQFAECCCQIKQAVGVSEQNITELIDSNESADLRLQLTAEETKNLISNLDPPRRGRSRSSSKSVYVPYVAPTQQSQPSA